MNFKHLSGPTVHANTLGVFDQTGGDLSVNGTHFGLCLEILRERRPWRARIGDVVNSEKRWYFKRLNLVCTMGIFLLMGSCEKFLARSAQKFSIKVWLNFSGQSLVDRYATFKQGPKGRLKFSGQDPVKFFSVTVCPEFFNQCPVEIF